MAAPRWVACAALGGLPALLGFDWLFCLVGAFVSVLRVLAFPCFASGLLALPLCGAAPTFLCRLQRKVGKRKQLKPLMLSGNRSSEPPVAPWNLCSLTFSVGDKGIILPAALRAPKSNSENQGAGSRAAGAVGFASARRLTGWLRVARATEVEGIRCEWGGIRRTTGLLNGSSGEHVVRDGRYDALVTSVWRCTNTDSRCTTTCCRLRCPLSISGLSRFLLPTFLCGGKEK